MYDDISEQNKAKFSGYVNKLKKKERKPLNKPMVIMETLKRRRVTL